MSIGTGGVLSARVSALKSGLRTRVRPLRAYKSGRGARASRLPNSISMPSSETHVNR